MSKHHCHAMGCGVATHPTKLMCHEHWALVPVQLRADVNEHYRNGQCDDRRVSRAWLRAAREAINAVAVFEGRMTQAQADAWPKVAP